MRLTNCLLCLLNFRGKALTSKVSVKLRKRMILLARRCFHWFFAIFIPNPGEMIQFSQPCFKMGEEKTGWCLGLVMSKWTSELFKMAIFSTKWWANAQRLGGWPLAKKTSRRFPHEWESNGDRWGCCWKRSDVSAPGKPVKIRSCRWNFGEVETWRWGGKKVFN